MNVIEKTNMNTCANSVHGGELFGADGEMSPRPEGTPGVAMWRGGQMDHF